jgi:tetratricopeptide (TPR) repeat protein
VLVASCSLSTSSHAEPPPEAQANDHAMALFGEARAAYERGEYRAAMAKLEEAIALDPGGKELVYNLALIHEKLGDIEEAEREFQHYLTMEADAKQRERVQGILKRLEGAKKDVHEHRLAPSASSAPPSAPSPPPPLPPPPATISRLNPWVYVLGGTALGAFGVGTSFAVSALAGKPGANATTGGSVTYQDLREEAESAHRRAVLADVSLAIAAMSGGATLVLMLTGRGVKSPKPPPQAAVSLAPGYVTVEARF